MDIPGELVPVGTHRLHVVREGSGTPAVVFDSALAGSVLSWVRVQPAVATLTATVSYDRAGRGWSEPGPMPRALSRTVDELRAVLAAASVAGPFVLVGHSYGALVVRLFAARFPRDVCGLVLVDPAHPKDWIHPAQRELDRIALGVTLCRRGAAAARFGLARVVATLVRFGALDVARVCARAVSRGSLGREHEEILAPVSHLPAAYRRHLFRMWSRRDFFEAVGSEIETIQAAAAELLPYADAGYGDWPLAVLSASDPEPSRVVDQEHVARLSTRGRHLVARRSGHWIPLEEPDLVIDAITRVVAEARGERR